MGGRMSVNDEKELLWLVQEEKLIRQFVGMKAPVLGIYMSAQAPRFIPASRGMVTSFEGFDAI
jgi:hypothetical protein